MSERLTGEERAALESGVCLGGHKAIQIIERLTEALNAAQLKSAHEKRTRERLVRHYTKRRDRHFARAEDARQTARKVELKLEQVKRYVQDVTLFSDPTLRIELARLLGLNWQDIYQRSRALDVESNDE
jgi:hypothetical protein